MHGWVTRHVQNDYSLELKALFLLYFQLFPMHHLFFSAGNSERLSAGRVRSEWHKGRDFKGTSRQRRGGLYQSGGGAALLLQAIQTREKGMSRHVCLFVCVCACALLASSFLV